MEFKPLPQAPATGGNAVSSRQPAAQQNHNPELCQHEPECTKTSHSKFDGNGPTSKKDQIEQFLRTHWDVKQMLAEVEEEQRQLNAYYKHSCAVREEQNNQAMLLLDHIVKALDARKEEINQKDHIAEKVESYKQRKGEDRELAMDDVQARDEEQQKVLCNLEGCLQRLAPVARRLKVAPKYISYPEVEVTIKVNYISNVDTADMKFEIDLVLMIDWVDENFREIPEKQLAHLDWDETYFNPFVILENAVAGEDQEFMEGRDIIPRLDKFDSHGLAVPDDKDRIWLKKTQRWRGYMAMEDVDLSCFPFDMQVLPILIKALPLRLSAGRLRQPRLVHPTKRLGDEQYKRVATGSNQQYAMKHTGGGQFIGPMVDEQLIEFRLKGVRGVTDTESQRNRNRLTTKVCSGEQFQVHVFVERPPFSSYTWNLVIMTSLVFLSATSFWDTAAPELSSRLSISLTIILTLAAYTSNRPAPIEKTPSLTFQDEYTMICLTLVIFVSFMNIISVVRCGGDSPNAPDLMQETFADNEDECSLGMCGSREIDCNFFFLFMLISVITVSYKLFQVYHLRQESTQEIREMTSVLVAAKKKQRWSELSSHLVQVAGLVEGKVVDVGHNLAHHAAQGVEEATALTKRISQGNLKAACAIQ